ncbi:UTRA domain-containing protein [Streptomyces sp. NPDC006458]|uniref:GntR family transcriptional regulator n=1 Tax=Streptomyces sp. NPDC006458 TaxID=3154302 RepID=UPI0033BF6D43
MSESGWVSSSLPYLTPRVKGQTDAWGAEAAAKGGQGGQLIVFAGEAPAPAEVAELLGIPAGEPVVVRRRVIQLDGVPSELTDTYYPVDIARGTRLAEKGRIPGGAVTYLAELGYVGVRVQEDVTARMPGPAERETLRLDRDEPALRLSRLTLDGDDRPLQVDMIVLPAHRQRLRYEIQIG